MKKIQRPDTSNPDTWLTSVRERTPARVLVGRAGLSYRTGTLLKLRSDHASAVDAVWEELQGVAALPEDFVKIQDLFVAESRATSKTEYLMRPDLGRSLSDASKTEILHRRVQKAELQVAIGDGLSPLAVISQTPALTALLQEGAESRGWRFGRPFLIRYCRVGMLNEIGDLLRPTVVVLLIGERPGLITAESMSAYMAYRPQTGHTDAQRNLISNIHPRGVSTEEAASRILRLAERMMLLHTSGISVKELLTPPLPKA